MVRDGVFFPDPRIADWERWVFATCADILHEREFDYRSVPSTVTRDTIERQGTVPWDRVVEVGPDLCLSGSAEQGLLEMYRGQTLSGGQLRLYALNQCFRREETYKGLKHLREFRKLEQFVFCGPDNWKREFEIVLDNVKRLMATFEIDYRVENVTERDPGYHLHKLDVEVWTTAYGWLETHSLAYFGEEQTRRFDIKGLTHTISATGVASPRFLVPLLERGGILFPR